MNELHESKGVKCPHCHTICLYTNKNFVDDEETPINGSMLGMLQPYRGWGWSCFPFNSDQVFGGLWCPQCEQSLSLGIYGKVTTVTLPENLVELNRDLFKVDEEELREACHSSHCVVKEDMELNPCPYCALKFPVERLADHVEGCNAER